MEVIYEVPNTFRITHIPCFTLDRWSERSVTRRTPFVLDYRAPGNTGAVEHVELTEELFEAFVCVPVGSEHAVKLFAKHLTDEFQMSEGMTNELLTAPKTLVSYVHKEHGSDS